MLIYQEEVKMKWIIATAFTLIAMPALAAETMTGNELEGLLGTDRTVTLSRPETASSGEVSFKSDGTASGTIKREGGKVEQVTGVWYIVGDQFCYTWKGIKAGTEVCETWLKDGPNKARVLVKGKEVGFNTW